MWLFFSLCIVGSFCAQVAHGGTLKVQVLNGHVPDTDGLFRGASDSLVKGNVAGLYDFRTSEKSDTNNPVWMETFYFSNVPETADVEVVVIDCDQISGSCSGDTLASGAFVVSPSRNVSLTWGGGSYFIKFQVTYTPTNLCLLSANGGCPTSSQCVFLGDNKSNCSCISGYGFAKDGSCQLLNPCMQGPVCGRASTCSNPATFVFSCTCDEGNFSPSGDGSNCVALTICAPGTYVSGVASSSTDRTCSSCLPGHECSGGDILPIPCGAPSRYSPGGTINECFNVSYGYYAVGGTSAAMRTGQALCPIGSACNEGIMSACVAGIGYQMAPGQNSCMPCSECALGLSPAQACTSSVDTICADTTPPVLTLLGPANVILEAIEGIYVEEGCLAFDSYDGNLTNRIVVSSSLNLNFIGLYDANYTVQDHAGNHAVPVRRTLQVRDTLPPTLSLIPPNTLFVEVGSRFVDPFALAFDLLDGDVSDNISVAGLGVLLSALNATPPVLGNYTLAYQVSDKSGNIGGPVNRTVVLVDTTLPVITLIGPSRFVTDVISEADTTAYEDPGATCYDAGSGNLTSYIVRTGLVDLHMVGEYVLHFNALDPSTNQSAQQVDRVVVVLDRTPPTLTLLGPSQMDLEGGEPFIDPFVHFSDNYDSLETLSTALTISYSPKINVFAKAGTSFTITYSLKDSSRNTALSVFRVLSIIDTTPPVLNMFGNGTVFAEVGQPYQDAGGSCNDSLSGSLPVVDNHALVNIWPLSVPTAFVVTYSCQDASKNSAVSLYRSVIIRDTTKPVIVLKVDEPVLFLEIGADFVEPPVLARDNFDGDITASLKRSYVKLLQSGSKVVASSISSVNVSPNTTYIITYTVQDKSGNEANPVLVSVVVIDAHPPTLSLLGSEFVVFQAQRPRSSSYIDAGVSSMDDVDGDVSDLVRVSSVRDVALGLTNISIADIDPSRLGAVYAIYFEGLDKSGNVACCVKRTVQVEDTAAPIIAMNMYNYSATYSNTSTRSSPTGSDEIVNLVTGDFYVEPGATAWDAFDGDVSSFVQISGNISSGKLNQVGVFEVVYTVSDAQGNIKISTRQVRVSSPGASSSSESPSQYLTSHVSVFIGFLIGILLILLLVILVVVVAVRRCRRKSQPPVVALGGFSDDQNQTISFINPIYDDADEVSGVWYHGLLSQPEIEQRMNMHGLTEGLFLVFKTSEDEVYLAAYFGDAFCYYKTQIDGDGIYNFEGYPPLSEPCNNLSSVIRLLRREKQFLPSPLGAYVPIPTKAIYIRRQTTQSLNSSDLTSEDTYGVIGAQSSSDVMVNPCYEMHTVKSDDGSVVERDGGGYDHLNRSATNIYELAAFTLCLHDPSHPLVANVPLFKKVTYNNQMFFKIVDRSASPLPPGPFYLKVVSTSNSSNSEAMNPSLGEKSSLYDNVNSYDYVRFEYPVPRTTAALLTEPNVLHAVPSSSSDTDEISERPDLELGHIQVNIESATPNAHPIWLHEDLESRHQAEFLLAQEGATVGRFLVWGPPPALPARGDSREGIQNLVRSYEFLCVCGNNGPSLQAESRAHLKLMTAQIEEENGEFFIGNLDEGRKVIRTSPPFDTLARVVHFLRDDLTLRGVVPHLIPVPARR